VPAIWRKRPLSSGVGTSSAKFLHSAAIRRHSSVYFWTRFDSDTALLLTAGSTCISQSSAGPIDGAGDSIKMGTSGLLCEACFSKMSLSTRRHCAPGLQFERCFLIRSFQAYSFAQRSNLPSTAHPHRTTPLKICKSDAHLAAHPSSCSTRKSPAPQRPRSLSGRRRGAYRTRNVDPKALPQASSAFRSVRCENIANIAPHIAAYIRRMGMVYLSDLHSEHQLSGGLRSSIRNGSSTNINLYKIAHYQSFLI
jgi:hypothetical protein